MKKARNIILFSLTVFTVTVFLSSGFHAYAIQEHTDHLVEEILNGQPEATNGADTIRNNVSNEPVTEDQIREITNSNSNSNSNSSSNNTNNSNTNTNNTNSGNSSDSNNSGGGSGNALFEGRTDCGVPFLGMTPWDCGVTITDSQESLKKEIWKIAANIATDITILASYLALGYVIYGGYLYTFSGDNPTKAASGKKALSQAFIGLAIAMSAAAIMSTIRAVLISDSDLTNCATNGCIEADSLFISALHWFIGMAGVFSAIFIVYGGISYSTSAGSTEKLRKSKTMIINALIGLAIVALAELILAFVSSKIREANQGINPPRANPTNSTVSASPNDNITKKRITNV